MVEALAQSMALLVMKTLAAQGIPYTSDKIFYFAGIDNARFKRPVFPGDQLKMKVKLVKQRGQIWKAEAEAYVEDQLVCSAELLASYKG